MRRSAQLVVADGVRRLVSTVVAAVVLLLVSPVLVVAAVAVRASMGGPVLFRQRRLGLGGRPFDLYKLRTMRDAAPGRESAAFDGERLTRLGAWLRSTSIDELPSLLNVLKGDMVLVGPRPLPMQYWGRFRGDEYRRFEALPGLTGRAQVSGRNSLDWPDRLALDVRYVDERTLLGDLWIVVCTVPMVVRRTGVAHSDAVATMHELPANR